MTPLPDVELVQCRSCHADVPSAAFCGRCGADPADPPVYRQVLLRPAVFAAAPREPITLPLVTSSLFPHLPQPSRAPFRLGLFLLLLTLVMCSALRFLGPLVTVAALGVPLLFGLYLWQSGVLRDMPNHALAVATVAGIALGVSWVLLTGGLVARSYGIPMAAGFMLQHLLGVGLAISVGGALAMVLPAVIVRLLWSATNRGGPRESLDGFVIGALGSLSFTAAATITRLAPQFTAGLIENVRPLRLFVEAVLYGMAIPLTATAAGGLIGIMLWFRPGERAGAHPRRIRTTLVVFTVGVIGLYSAVWVIDAARLPKIPQLGLHLLVTVAALLAVRIGMQMALLHERTDDWTGRPVLCVHCEKVVPEMPFCPACGASARAASRSSRQARRDFPPVPESLRESGSDDPTL